jgi:hypothetical protein
MAIFMEQSNRFETQKRGLVRRTMHSGPFFAKPHFRRVAEVHLPVVRGA